MWCPSLVWIKYGKQSASLSRVYVQMGTRLGGLVYRFVRVDTDHKEHPVLVRRLPTRASRQHTDHTEHPIVYAMPTPSMMP